MASGRAKDWAFGGIGSSTDRMRGGTRRALCAKGPYFPLFPAMVCSVIGMIFDLTERVVSMAKQHSPRFLQLTTDAQSKVKRCSIEQARAELSTSTPPVLIDVREESEYAAGHLPNAWHLGAAFLNGTSKQKSQIRLRESSCIAEVDFVLHWRPKASTRWATPM